MSHAYRNNTVLYLVVYIVRLMELQEDCIMVPGAITRIITDNGQI